MDFKWVKKARRGLQRQVSKCRATLAYEDTKHFLTWLAYPILVNMLFSPGMEKDTDFSLIVTETAPESRLESKRK